MLDRRHATATRAALVAALLVVTVTGCTAGEPAATTPAAVSPPVPATPPTPEATAPSAEPTPRQAPPRLVMWGRDQVTADVARAAADVPGVAAVAFQRRANVGLVRATTSDGEVVTALEDGWRIGLRATSVDAAALAAVVPAAEAMAPLTPGTAVLPASSAELRGVGVGGQLVLLDDVALRVVAVVPDEVVGSSELVVHPDDAERLGWDPDGAIVVALTTDAVVHEVAAGLEALVEDPDRARVIEVDETGARSATLVLPTLEVKQRFGEFAHRPRAGVREIDIERAWVAEHIVTEDVPILGRITCHREVMPDVRAAFQALRDRGLEDWVVPSRYAGCSYARRTSTDPDGNLSRHSWGIAIDVNVDVSKPGGGAVPPDEVIEAWADHGFRWGGDFLTPDNHHWEWVGEAAADRFSRSGA